MEAQLAHSYADFIFFGCILRSGMTGSYCKSIFRYLRNLHTVLHNGLCIQNGMLALKAAPLPAMSQCQPQNTVVVFILEELWVYFYLV